MQNMQNGIFELSPKKNIILIADDDFFMRSLVKTALEDIVKVVQIESGEQVLESYKQHNPAVLLLDIHMPDKSGKQILLDILEYDPNAYVIMLSADSQIQNVRETHIKGAKGFIAKPFNKDVLMKYILPVLSFSD